MESEAHIVGVNYLLGLLYRVDVGDASDVSELNAAFIFKVEVRS
jgi:hypothetical protein